MASYKIDNSATKKVKHTRLHTYSDWNSFRNTAQFGLDEVTIQPNVL